MPHVIYCSPMYPNRRTIPRNVLVLAFVALASGFGQDLITPALPGYLALIGVSHAGIGLIDGLLQGSTSFFRLVSGFLSDRFQNRKRFVFLGYALSSLARPLLAVGSGFVSVAALRIVDGAGKGTKDAPRDALIAESASPAARGRAFGFHRLVDTAGSVLGPALAGVILLAGASSLASYRTIFWLAAFPGAIALALILFGIRESASVPTSRTMSIKRSRIPTIFWVFTLAATVVSLARANDALILLRVQEGGIVREWIPFLFAGFTVLYAALSYPIGIWSDRIGRLPLLAAGWLVLALVEFGFSNTPGVTGMLTLMAGFGLFYALTEGSSRAIIADLVPPDRRGAAYGMWNTATGLALIVGGLLLGRIWDAVGFRVAFTFSAVGTLFGALIILWTSFHMSHGPTRSLEPYIK